MCELHAVEWTRFLDGFSRQVIQLGEDRRRTLADRLPLLGITAEPCRGPARVIQVMLGDAASGDVSHVIRSPLRMRVAGISNGQDEMLLIDSDGGATTRINFRPVTADDWSRPARVGGAGRDLTFVRSQFRYGLIATFSTPSIRSPKMR